MNGFTRFALTTITLLCLAVTLSAGAAVAQFANAPVVHTQYGDVRGVTQGAVESFKALPFAAPPVGDLRWKPPQDPANWAVIRDGSKFSMECPQKKDILTIIGSEDCLYLNVFKPQGAQGLPVMVFIHGGHNAIGSAGMTENGVAAFDGSELAQNGNVVVVTINYRLGALGFIAHPKLSNESRHGSGNYGYMDQIQALKWVSRNIAGFGGDPNNITLFGASSGGGGISVLMASPLAQGLFHRAIIHSGQFATQDLTNAHNTGIELSARLHCQNGPDELKCMRDKSSSDIVMAMAGGHGPGASVSGPRRFLPVVDAWILPDVPLEIIRRGEHYHVPLLIGNVQEETSWIYMDDSIDIVTEQHYKDKVTLSYGNIAPQLLNLYPVSDYESPRQAYNAISADHWFVCPAQRLTQAISGHQSEFVGRFLYTRILPLVSVHPPHVPFGASHSFDLMFVFGTFGFHELPPTPDDLTLKEKFQKTWTDFARSGRPGNFWNRYYAAQDNFVIFNTPMSGGNQLRTKQCDHWNPVDIPAPEVPGVAGMNVGKLPVVNEGPHLPRELYGKH